MSVYVVGCFSDIEPSPDLGTYGAHVRATLEPFEGRFLARDAPFAVLEGDWPAQITVLIEFPDRERAEGWYASQPYQELVPLRAGHSTGWIVAVDDGTAETGPRLG